jgi:hypothetical protein
MTANGRAYRFLYNITDFVSSKAIKVAQRFRVLRRAGFGAQSFCLLMFNRSTKSRFARQPD